MGCRRISLVPSPPLLFSSSTCFYFHLIFFPNPIPLSPAFPTLVFFFVYFLLFPSFISFSFSSSSSFRKPQGEIQPLGLVSVSLIPPPPLSPLPSSFSPFPSLPHAPLSLPPSPLSPSLSEDKRLKYYPKIFSCNLRICKKKVKEKKKKMQIRIYIRRGEKYKECI